MEKATLFTIADVLPEWNSLVRRFKETLAKRLWAIGSVSEAEKETVYRAYLFDLDGLELEVGRLVEATSIKQHHLEDENQLLRNLMGLKTDDVRAKNLGLGLDLDEARKKTTDLEQTVQELTTRLADMEQENSFLRKRLHEIEERGENLRLSEIHKREDDIRYFANVQEKLNRDVKDLETRLANIRLLYTENNKTLLVEKQDEITLLQKKLLEEMESTLKQRTQMVWAEEELFAKGVARRVRTALVSAQGELYLTLERLGLMDPETKNEDVLKSRLHLLLNGGSALSLQFKKIAEELQSVTHTLDDYMHLTGQRSLAKEPVDLKALIDREVAFLYADRQPMLHLEVLSDDPMPTVLGDRELLEFSLKALLQNAREALPHDKGDVTIYLKNRPDAHTVTVLVKDNGVGIPGPAQSKLFQPFFSLKEGRQGLSLSRARRYVELHGGALILSESGPKGSVFEMTVPYEGGV